MVYFTITMSVKITLFILTSDVRKEIKTKLNRPKTTSDDEEDDEEECGENTMCL